ncbi:putative lipid II flippase FtsW [Aquella oligotrophica]|uniref:Probable peptidoglycan glycosyltransferase FtsW n=1 Tax=Aquella oligotrophica TaxID=2067065 RepID=A0A2I7N3X1_9NEIS|nr:putative lipid II flippase FtsW [Aquella oligotrophica]AUR51152.1 putative lipid II flippase FtsW [Aquella oligotrophica]
MRLFRKTLNQFSPAKPRNIKVGIDNNILFAAILLLTLGLLMVYSASIAYAGKDSGSGNQYFYMIRHVMAISLGLVIGVLAFNLPTSFWQKNSNKIIVGVIILLIAVLIPHVGRLVNGSRRWLPLGLLNLQPSELAKIGIAIYMANYFCGKTLSFRKFRSDVLPVTITLLTICGLLLAEPDMGSTTVVFLIALTILFLSDLDVRLIIAMVLLGAVAFVLLIVFEPYRMKRVVGFLNPWEDSLGKGYQLSHSLLAYGHGGWLGVGLGNSIEKLYYLPEAHTDFIMAIIGEEFGVIGVIAVLVLFWIIFYRGFTIIASEAKRLPQRKFQGLLAQGISVWFFAQAIVNIGVSIGILPTKGLTLPFVSFGGSSILVNCIALAILLKIDYENKLVRQGVKVE